MATTFLTDGPDHAKHAILLAHGAGAPMDSVSMTATAEALAGSGFRVARFEFGYMASRRTEEGRKPPPRAEKLIPEYIAAIEICGIRQQAPPDLNDASVHSPRRKGVPVNGPVAI